MTAIGNGQSGVEWSSQRGSEEGRNGRLVATDWPKRCEAHGATYTLKSKIVHKRFGELSLSAVKLSFVISSACISMFARTSSCLILVLGHVIKRCHAPISKYTLQEIEGFQHLFRPVMHPHLFVRPVLFDIYIRQHSSSVEKVF